MDKATDSIEVTKHDLLPKIDMRVVRGQFDDILVGHSDDYIFFELTDDYTQHEAMNRLKQRYPNAMSLEYTALKNEQTINHTTKRKVFQEKPVWDQFGDFYAANTSLDLSEYQTTIVQDAFKAILEED